jgi:HEPN superfamily AbiU2-like protein
MTQSEIPIEIEEIYTPLYHQVCHLHAQWGIYCQLYASGKEVINLLNSSSAGFFHVCQDVLASQILLTISRLTDPKETRIGKNVRENLTLERLSSSVDQVRFTKLGDEVKKRFSEAKEKCRFAREVRNKLLAHSDLSTSLHGRAELASTTNKKNMERAFESICDVMNAVPGYFDDSTVAYTLASTPSDGTVLIARLRDARNYRQQLREFGLSLQREA